MLLLTIFFFFFFNDTATTEIYTLSLHDALPISRSRGSHRPADGHLSASLSGSDSRSEEHTSELQSPCNLVCRLLLEKKKKQTNISNVSGSHKHLTSYVPERHNRLYICNLVRHLL